MHIFLHQKSKIAQGFHKELFLSLSSIMNMCYYYEISLDSAFIAEVCTLHAWQKKKVLSKGIPLYKYIQRNEVKRWYSNHHSLLMKLSISLCSTVQGFSMQTTHLPSNRGYSVSPYLVKLNISSKTINAKKY